MGVSLATAVTLVSGASAAPVARTASVPAAAPTVVNAATSGRPPAFHTIKPGTYFSYLKSSRSNSLQIRNRVVNTVNSTWGLYYTNEPNTATADPNDTKRVAHRGTIRMATWSFGDRGMTNALIAARKRGVVVQILAASSINNDGAHPEWGRIRRALNGHGLNSFARQCSGACRGPGGAAHSKYFLFNDVGSKHQRNITVQTSMNLTSFAWQGQWNQATAMYNANVYKHFYAIFNQSASNGRTGTGYRAWATGNITDIFFPMGSHSRDPIARALNNVRCKGATAGGINGRTRVRAINYALLESRGLLLAKKFRSLWNAGCDVRIIYSITNRPVLKVLRSRSGRGPVPMKQTVIKNGRGDIVKYNHSKWLAISGVYSGVSRGSYSVISGSSNWSNLSYTSDEQMQRIFGYSATKPYFTNFTRTWNQGISKTPPGGRLGARSAESLSDELAAVPEKVEFGKGAYKYLSPEGD